MSYRVRRIDPYWNKNPLLPVVALVGVLVGLLFVSREAFVPAALCGAVAGVAVFLATQPAVSAVMGVFGAVGGLMTFVLFPKPEVMGMSFAMRLLSAILFSLFYTVLMDGVILLVAVLYNLFAGAVGLGGFSLALEEGGEGGA